MSTRRVTVLRWSAIVALGALLVWLTGILDEGGRRQGSADGHDVLRSRGDGPLAITPFGATGDESHDPGRIPDSTDILDELTHGVHAPKATVPTARGHVVAAAGRPVRDASVWIVPDIAVLNAFGLSEHQGVPILDALPNEQTAEDGSFSVPWTSDVSLSVLGESAGEWPHIVVRCAGYTTAAVECVGFTESDYDVGTIVLQTGLVVRGRVVDENQRGIEGARVSVVFGSAGATGDRDGEGSRIRDVVSVSMTDDFGQFDLPGLASAAGSLVVRATGYRTKIVPLGDAGDRHSIIELEIRLESGSSIVGRILGVEALEAAGRNALEVYAAQPFSSLARRAPDGDTIQLDYRNATRIGARGVIDNHGVFRIDGLDDATYSVYVGGSGFEPARVDGVTPGGELVQITLSPCARLALSVVSEVDGTPVADCVITATRVSGHPLVEDRPTLGVHPALSVDGERENGRVVTHVVDCVGTYRTDVRVAADGYAITTACVPGDGEGGGYVVIRLPPESRILGVVRAATGTAIEGAEISAESADAGCFKLDVEPATSDGDGAYLVSRLGRGSWRLSAEADGYARSEIVVEIQDAGLDVTQDIELARGAAVWGIARRTDGVILVGESVSISRPVEAEQRSGPDASHRVRREVFQARTDRDGRFEFTDMAPGEWTIGRDPTGPFRLAGGDTVQHDLVLPAPARIEGYVRADQGAGTISALVSVTNCETGRQVEAAFTDESGHFVIEVFKAGCYDVTGYIATPTVGATEPRKVILAMSESAFVELQPSIGRVAGRVIDSIKGEPVQGVVVTCRPTASSGYRVGYWTSGGRTIIPWPRSDEHGRYSLHCGLGENTLEFKKEGFIRRSVDVMVDQDGIDEMTVELVPGGSVTGTIRESSGALIVTGLMVVLYHPGDAEARWSAYTENGSFRIEDVADGEYVIAVVKTDSPYTDPAAALSMQEIAVVPGGSVTVDLTVPVPAVN